MSTSTKASGDQDELHRVGITDTASVPAFALSVLQQSLSAVYDPLRWNDGFGSRYASASWYVLHQAAIKELHAKKYKEAVKCCSEVSRP